MPCPKTTNARCAAPSLTSDPCSADNLCSLLFLKEHSPPGHDDSQAVSLSGGGAGSSGSGSASSAASSSAVAAPVALAVATKENWFRAFKTAMDAGGSSLPLTFARIDGELEILDFVAHAAAAGETGVVNSSATLLGVFASLAGAAELADSLDKCVNDEQCMAFLDGLASASSKAMLIAMYVKSASTLIGSPGAPRASPEEKNAKLLHQAISANSVAIIFEHPFILRLPNNEIVSLLRKMKAIIGEMPKREVAAAVASNPTAFGKKARTVLTGRAGSVKTSFKEMLFGKVTDI